MNTEIDDDVLSETSSDTYSETSSGSSVTDSSDTLSSYEDSDSNIDEYFSDDDLVYKINNLKMFEYTKSYNSDSEMYDPTVDTTEELIKHNEIDLFKIEKELNSIMNLKMDMNYFEK